MYINVYGITGLILLILDLWAIVSTVNSARDTGSKVLWVLVILLFPILGLIAWVIAGPRSS